MAETAQLALQRTLSSLTAEKARIEKEIQVVRAALTALGVSSPNLVTRRHRKPMTKAERNSVSKRMKRYWAKRRAQEKKVKRAA
jgi:hypothetical protein